MFISVAAEAVIRDNMMGKTNIENCRSFSQVWAQKYSLHIELPQKIKIK